MHMIGDVLVLLWVQVYMYACIFSLQVLEVIAGNKAVAIKVAKDRQVHVHPYMYMYT